jgi:FkbM family methyltransferase
MKKYKVLRNAYFRSVRLFDRQGWRWALKFSVNTIAKIRHSKNRINFQEGFWVHRLTNLLVVDGVRFWYPRTIVGSPVKEQIKYTELPMEYWFFQYTPKQGDVIVDIGAGKGEDTFVFSREVRDTGHVIAVEALPSTFACLQYFVKKNGLQNVSPIQVAISDNNDEIMMTDDEVSWLSNSIEIAAPSKSASKKVKTITFDSLVNERKLKKIDFLKMNIEGAECAALRGMTDSLQIIDNICISCHDFRFDRGESEYFRTMVEVENTLTAAGFTLTSRKSDTRPYIACQVNGTRLKS